VLATFEYRSPTCENPEIDNETYELADRQWVPLGMPARWAVAGPSGQIAFVTPSDALTLRQADGSERLIADGVDHATWVGPQS
jgi:hypothetical protein